MDALALNMGETVADGVVDADFSALARPRVTGMVAQIAQGGGEGWGQVLRGYQTRRDKTRLNLIYGRV